ncbi:type IIL restriction-modification enzyme MmeI, partial [Propionivibrio sp.]|uniref:type IIL restriction-modification enzyme MmeI n=1 Tax=Propionivibrio sp. TaxID=2212460 RepID=UPI003BF2616B
AGLVATNSIRGGANQTVLSSICASTKIFNAWSDEAWINEGAAVRVSLVCFGGNEGALLDGETVDSIHADLSTGDGLNLTQAKPLKENVGVCFMGASKKAPFDIEGEKARQWLKLPNPNGLSNSAVVRPLCNAMNITRRPSDTWIVDFGTDMSEADAALYELPFEYVTQYVKPEREKNNREAYRKFWWRHAEARPGMRTAIKPHNRFIATPAVSKHRLFIFLDASVLPDQATLAVARADDTNLGILHSRLHELWALRLGTSLEDRPRYTPSTCFETFPFPAGLTPRDTLDGVPNSAAAINIASAALELNRLRNNWLNPPEWVDWVITPEEESAGFPKRPQAKAGHEAELKKRTLTGLYNARPAWLDNAHRNLDAAVAAAYGWTDYSPATTDDEILRKLLVLNLQRSALT